MPTDNNIQLNSFLSPLSFLYGLGVKARNQLFDWGLLPSERYPIPIISIGNLAVGGTGKTPHTEYIIRLLKNEYKIAVLSRGYKRQSSGFLLANTTSTSREIGDEPFQMKNKFPDILVAVDANRRRGIRNLLALPDEQRPEVILLDDAFQHRYVIPSLSIVLTDYHRLFYSDKLMPVGLLREPIHGIRRADMVIVTKCKEDMKPIEYRIIEENMKLRAHQLLYFTHIVYDEIKPVFPAKSRNLTKDKIKKKDDILLVSGIASPGHFFKEVKKYSNRIQLINFPDHHDFNKRDFKRMKAIVDKMPSANKWILVTEKDAARLKDNPLVPDKWKDILYYLPITINFCVDKAFNETIKKHVVTVQRNRILY